MAYNDHKSQYLEVGANEFDGGNSDYAPSRSPSPRRKSGESSPTRSEYDDSVEDIGVKPKLIFNAMNTKSGMNVRILDEEGICRYYIDNSSFTPKKPDVTLCAGSEKTSPVVGVCKWQSMYSSVILVGLGDPKTNESGVVWEEMKSEKKFHIDFHWTFESTQGPPRQFVWKRVHSKEATADNQDANYMSTKNYKLIDEGTGDVVALFGSNRYKSWSKLGKLTLLADHGERWRLLVLLTCMGIIEKSRRRSRARRSNPGVVGG